MSASVTIRPISSASTSSLKAPPYTRTRVVPSAYATWSEYAGIEARANASTLPCAFPAEAYSPEIERIWSFAHRPIVWVLTTHGTSNRLFESSCLHRTVRGTDVEFEVGRPVDIQGGYEEEKTRKPAL